MTSAIDPTHPTTGVPVSKAASRANWQAAKDEIEDLQSGKADAAHTHAVPHDLNATGSPSSTTFLRGDGVWAVPPGNGGGSGNGVTPEEFGAAGDGVTDDTTALQNAVNSAAANKNILVLKSGKTYLIRNPVTATSRIHIVGWGARIKLDAGNWSGSWGLRLNGGATARSVLRGFEIDGSGLEVDGLLYIVGASEDSRVEALRIHNLTRTSVIATGIHVNGAAHGLVITECVVEDIDGNGGIAKGILLRNTSGHGPAYGVRIVNNTLRNMPDAADTDAVNVMASSGGENDVDIQMLVADNTFENIGKRAVKCQRRGVLIVGNTVRHTLSTEGYAAFGLYHSDCAVIGNKVVCTGTGGYSRVVGTVGSPAADRSIVKGNLASRSSSIAVEAIEMIGADDFMIEGNSFNGPWRNFIMFRGTTNRMHIIGNSGGVFSAQPINRINTGFSANNCVVSGNTFRHSAGAAITWPATSQRVICTGNLTSSAIGRGLTGNVTGLMNTNNVTLV
jgi:hypothetical protein